MSEKYDRIQAFEIHVETDQAWETVDAGATIGADKTIILNPTTTPRIRLNNAISLDGPTLWEFKVLADRNP